jgi:hypothetical protein
MATPQYASAIVQSMETGQKRIYRVYCSDAAGAVTFPDGTTSITFPARARLVDLIFAATLATTPTLTINVGGLPVTVLNTATLTAATIARPVQQAPIEIPQGSSLNIVQA